MRLTSSPSTSAVSASTWAKVAAWETKSSFIRASNGPTSGRVTSQPTRQPVVQRLFFLDRPGRLSSGQRITRGDCAANAQRV
jgi:hypothetical protein